ncbi:helix-turn-helix domain-containing protein [Nocardia tengchongensis]
MRYRLRRIEELTDRSLNDPRTVLELGAALRALPVLK